MDRKEIHILAIESSCDDTSAAVLRDRAVLSNIIATQDVHQKFGGVIPELASRSHQKNIVPVVKVALEEAGISTKEINAIAYTRGPGLAGSLIVGSSFAKSLSLALDLPLIEVNHMRAHILAHFIESVHGTAPSFPFLCLTVSGGHTQIVLVSDYFDMKVIGKTVDDAAGEAFDKIAKLFGLEYPGGPLLDKMAQRGDPDKFSFAKPKMSDLDYSFSGLKTSVLYFLREAIERDKGFVENNLNDLCASVQKTIVEILMEKLELAAKTHKISHIALAGGVSANSALRKELFEQEKRLGWKTYIPPMEYCTDNAAMIGITGYFKYRENNFTNLSSVPTARMSL
ncbi:MAG TPA: tRNA (adenosine(37)-N6)-threonylcarbamoyltransferase complex transferase subunit TsaD [Flavobacteriales bacterium]|nr:tRNA (adenosine(37)-N6)-threonylcarbamoyltransferase complex transferase subunit TsaD [Flavobacteriales bacterium]